MVVRNLLFSVFYDAFACLYWIVSVFYIVMIAGWWSVFLSFIFVFSRVVLSISLIFKDPWTTDSFSLFAAFYINSVPVGWPFLLVFFNRFYLKEFGLCDLAFRWFSLLVCCLSCCFLCSFRVNGFWCVTLLFFRWSIVLVVMLCFTFVCIWILIFLFFVSWIYLTD